MRSFVSGLILAAGGSNRMGVPKQCLPFGGSTLLGSVVSRVTSAGSLEEVIVVLGGAVAEIRRRVDFERAKLVENPRFGEGCGSSFGVGIGALDPRSEAVTVVLGDQPGIEETVIDRVVEAWRQFRDPLVAASYEGRLGHPIIFARSIFPMLFDLRGDKAAWKLLDAHPEWVRRVAIDQPFPADVNTWQEYEALLRDATPPSA